MKLIFNEILITDITKKESKKIEFLPGINLVTSDKNSKGKSIILKSLYHTLGANCLFDDNFDKGNILFSLKFSYGDKNFQILRLKNDYIIKENGVLLDSIKYGNIQKLSKIYKDQLNMFVYLKNREKEILLAPPAFLFVPYYLDQDMSWKQSQESFINMGQFEKMSKNDLYYYHLGILSDEYFDINNKLKNSNQKLNNIKAELKNKDAIYLELKKELKSEVVVNLNELEIELRNLRNILSEKNENLENLKTKIYEKENEKIALQILIENINETLKKITKEGQIKTKHIICPNCKYEYDVNLKDEVEQLYNVEYLNNRKEKSLLDIKELDNSINKLKNEFELVLKDINKSKTSLFSKEKNYKAYLNRDAIQNLLDSKIKEIAQLEGEYQKQKDICSNLQQKLDMLNEKNIKVGPIFRQYYKSNLISLGVYSFNENKMKPFYKLPISGSLFARSTLAFFYTFLDVKKYFNNNKFLCPLVIDSPREGEQDDINSALILEYILSRDVGDYQLIVASVDAEKYINTEKLVEDINIIRLLGKENHLLTPEDYKKNLKEIENECSYFGI